jgi:(p)ppGpp synthase/HD superfamily hydrolase
LLLLTHNRITLRILAFERFHLTKGGLSMKTSKARPPGFELFFAPLQVALNPKDLEAVEFAYIASKFGHHGQERDNGRRYFDHPKNAAWIGINELNIRDPRILIITLLHDQSEDSYLLSSWRISLNFGKNTALDIRAVTKLPKGKETTEQYLQRIIDRGARSITAKLLDRLDNLRDLGGCTEDKRKKQIEETVKYHIPILIPALEKFGGIWKKYAQQLKIKLEEAMAEFT